MKLAKLLMVVGAVFGFLLSPSCNKVKLSELLVAGLFLFSHGAG